MNPGSRLPIGVFDSGLGGLTVVKELTRLLPSEDIIYVGDTARVPYGTKSAETITRYSMQITGFLIKKKVKAIVVACNSASAVALKSLKNLKVPVIGVINPGARAAVRASNSNKVGVIGTQATMDSHAYRKAIKRQKSSAQVWEKACPLFVPLVEEGWLNKPITKKVAQEYLAPLIKKGMDSLVLGCTHYPLLKKMLQSVVGKRVKLIDSAQETAKDVKKLLSQQGLLNHKSRRGNISFYVTDHPDSFSHLAHQFLGNRTHLAKRLSLENI